MKKYFFLFFLFGTQCFAAATDSIQLNSSIDPVCEISWNPQPIASNLDITASQTNLHVGTLILDSNTADSTLYQTNLSLDLSDHLTHSVVSSHVFTFDSASVYDNITSGGGAIPFGTFTAYDSNRADTDFLLSYTGIPALSLINGTYEATWYASCSVEPREP